MTEENTTASEPTTTETPASEVATPEVGSTDTSTTETPNPEPSEDGTILTPEGKTPEEEAETTEQTEEQKAAEEARAALYGAPEGDYTLPELPEGQTVDTEALAAVTPIAKELNLSDEGFGKIVNVYATEIVPKIQERIVGALEQDIAATAADWANQTMEMVRTDDMFKGQKLEDVQAISAKALDRFGGTELREYLQSTKLGNHPALVKAFYQIGSAISEDTTFERGGTAPVKKSSTEKFYGKQE